MYGKDYYVMSIDLNISCLKFGLNLIVLGELLSHEHRLRLKYEQGI